MPRATARMGVDPMLGSFLRNVVYAASLVIVVVPPSARWACRSLRCSPCSAPLAWRSVLH